MKCPYCGKELMSASIRCDGCGASLENNNQPNPDNNSVQEYNYQQNNSNNKSGILVLLLFLAAIGVVVYFMFFNNTSSNTEKKEENNVANQEVEENRIIITKKESYLKTASAYISAVRNEVNYGYNFRLYGLNTIYLIPVGDSKKCGILESGGSSPIGKEWNYAYVGVTYDGSGYSYYFISEDDLLNGIALTNSSSLSDYQIIYNNHNGKITDNISSRLKELYNISENMAFDSESIGELKDVLTPSNEKISKYIFISASAGCSLK